jgi:uncharacterized short protein YbdD (DUF466 family)
VLEKLTLDHATVRTAADALISILSGQAPDDTSALASARWAFASRLMQHLALKERYIYTKLEQHPDASVRTEFEKSKEDLLARFSLYTEHMRCWPTSRAVTAWHVYRVSAASVVQTFLDRLTLEERELFPLVLRSGIDFRSPSPPGENWTRRAFEVKDGIEKG